MLKVLSLFSGIGAFEKALDNLEVPFDLVAFCEFDKYAVKSYCAIHGVDESKNLGDITKVDETKLPKDLDILTYGFPCQDISLAGKQKGLFNEDGSQTRSGLFFEALRIIEHCQPKVAIAENVKNLVSKKFNAQFQVVLASLDAAGYNSYYAVLNSKDFGVPQNRDRVFIVSIRKDIDTGAFQFPEPIQLEKCLKDVFEEVVDQKYFLRKVLNMEMKDKYIQYDNSGKGYNSQAMRAYYQDGLAPTLPAMNAGGDKSQIVLLDKAEIQRIDIPQVVKVRKYPVNVKRLVEVLRVQKEKCGWTNKELAEELDLPITTVEHYFRTDEHFAIPEPHVWEDLKYLLEMDDIHEFDESVMTFEEKEGVFDKAERHYFTDGIAPTLTGAARNEKFITTDKSNDIRIRKLTPKECFRLMGFDDESFHKAEAVNSNTQLYKQAGNSIVVDVLEELFCMMIDEDGNLYV